IALGTYAGGWRIMRTLGQRVFQMDPPAGFAAQAAAGTVIWASTHYGYPLSTTHVVSGAVMGAGATKRLSAVRWGIAGNIVFVSPFDRDDLIVLAFAVDDVADAAENASELFGLYGVETPTKQALQLSGLLVRAAERLSALLRDLKQLRGSSEEIRLIKEIED